MACRKINEGVAYARNTKSGCKLKDYRNKNPNWRETDQLPIYKHEQEVEQGSTEKQLQLSGQSRIWTRQLRISGLLKHFLAANHKLIFWTGIQDPLILWMTHEQFS